MTDAAWLTQLGLPNRRWAHVKTWCRTHSFTPSLAQLAAMLEGGQVICRDILAEQQTIQDNNLCDLSILVPNNKGYCQPSIFGKKPMVLHRIAYLSVNARPAAGLDISHLCHHSTCCKPDHLVAEASILNQNRKGCAVWVFCPHQHPNNRQCIVWVCNHGNPATNTPWCIRNHPTGAYVDDMAGLKSVANGWCCG